MERIDYEPKNIRKSSYISIFGHLLIFGLVILFIFLDNMTSDSKPEKMVMMMVEPNADMVEDSPPPKSEVAEIKTPKIKELKRMELPEPEEEPEPEKKVEDKPEPKAVVVDKAKAKAVDKVEDKRAEEKPKKISAEDFKKKHPKKVQPKKSAPRVNFTPSKISVDSKSFDRIMASAKSSDGVSGVSAKVMMDYISYISMQAKRNWTLPESCQNQIYTVKVEFTVTKSGKVIGVRILRGSGSKEFDNSVKLVFSILNLTPPPSGKAMEVELDFRTDEGM